MSNNSLFISSIVVETSGQFQGPLDLTNNRIINVDSPVLGTDAVNKDYVDSNLGSTAFLIALNESLTGLSNEFGPCATPATIVVDNSGNVVTA